jgi:hypothetical protein
MTLWPWIRNIRGVDAFFFEDEWKREKEVLEMEKSYLLRKLTRNHDVMECDLIVKMRKGTFYYACLLGTYVLDLEINCRFFDSEESRDEVANCLESTVKKLEEHEKMALPKFQICVFDTGWCFFVSVTHL